MSLVYITHHNENIFDVEKDLKVEDGKAYNYISKQKNQTRKKINETKAIQSENGKKILTDSKVYERRTMGYAETPLSPPCDYLRKNQGVRWQRHRDHVCIKAGNISPVPKFERSVGKSKSGDHKHVANFVTFNIERVKNSKAKKHPPRFVDTPYGDTHNILNTGLVPQAVCLKNFGKVPCYLRVQKKMLENLKKQCHSEISHGRRASEDMRCPDSAFGPGVRELTTTERYDIMTGLKENYKELTKMYQSMSLYSDTISKKLRKGKMENDLRQLEQDILFVESNPVIFVSEY